MLVQAWEEAVEESTPDKKKSPFLISFVVRALIRGE
jgi:hypothetical protein